MVVYELKFKDITTVRVFYSKLLAHYSYTDSKIKTLIKRDKCFLRVPNEEVLEKLEEIVSKSKLGKSKNLSYKVTEIVKARK